MYNISGTDLGYDNKEYRKAIERIRQARLALNDLSPGLRGFALKFLDEAVSAAVCACKTLYSPLLDSDKLELVTSTSNDYHTDLADLEKLADSDKDF
jgi:hypothetical protein